MDRFSFRAAVHIAQAEFRQWLRSSRIIILFVMLVFVNVQVIGPLRQCKMLMGEMLSIPEAFVSSCVLMLGTGRWSLSFSDAVTHFTSVYPNRTGDYVVQLLPGNLYQQMTLEPGKIYGLVGSNGSGKTMLMKCICGFVHPTEGEINMDGRRVGKDVDYLPDAGIIIETPGFIPYYSGLQNLRLLAGIRRKVTDDQIRKALKITGLDPDSRLLVRKYSLGMRQRLGIAQAIMEQPDILILDEPMNGLDKHGVADIRGLLLELKKQGKLILLASHNPADIELLCDEVYEMELGNIRNFS